MNKHGDEIKSLINSNKLSASNITKPLNDIGDGSMLNGLQNIYDFAKEEGFNAGERTGIRKGVAITTIIAGIAILGKKGVNYFKKKIDKKKQHEIMGKKIKDALKEIPEEDDSNDDEKENV